MQNKAIKYRLYPNAQQRELFAKTFGCCRFVYNKLLDEQQRRHEAGEPHLSKYKSNDYCNHMLKEQFPWLREVDKFSLSNSVFALDDAYQRFFSKLGGFPHYKGKHGRQSYTTNLTNGNIAIVEKGVKLPKLGVVRAKIHRLPQDGWKIKSATVSLHAGKYYVSVLFEYEEAIAPVTVTFDSTLGLDYKTASLYVDSNAVCADMPKYYKASAKQLARAQKKLSRKQKNSNNRAKQKTKVAAISERVANQRKDFLHKQSVAIAKQYDLVCVEDISIKEQIAERSYRNFRKATLDNGWYSFATMLQYKLADRGKQLIKVDKHFPSSQRCSACGNVNTAIYDDRIRRWTCPACGVSHDRDVNAAINIREEGWRLYCAASA